jgi:hypothetical protein
MALYSVATGGNILAADVQQYYSLLTGAMTDQPATFAYTTTSLRSASGQVRLSRSAPSTNAHNLSFTGSLVSDFVIGRAANSDDLLFGYDNGSAFNEVGRFRANQAQGLWLTYTGAAAPSSSTFAGGMRLSLYGSIAGNDAAAYALGINSGTLWYNAPATAIHSFMVAGVEVAHVAAGGLVIQGSNVTAWDSGTGSGIAVNTTSAAINYTTNFNGRTPQVLVAVSQGSVIPTAQSATSFKMVQTGGSGTYAYWWIAVG